MRRFFVCAVCFLTLGLVAIPARADNSSLDDFLKQVKRQADVERKLNAAREANFTVDAETARRQVSEARQRLQQEQARQEALAKTYDNNEVTITTLEGTLRDQHGSLGEVFGVVRQSAGDFHARYLGSLAMAGQPKDLDFLGMLSNRRPLPNIDELERLWLIVLQEMADTAKVVKTRADVVTPDGRKEDRQIVRVGAFNAIAGDAYLSHIEGRNQFLVLPRQPQGRYLRLARDLESASAGEVRPFAVDPSRGAILSQLVQSPTLLERVRHGREIGLIILALGLFGVGLFAARYTFLYMVGRKVKGQLQSNDVRDDNPVGRILALYDQNPDIAPETLEVKLDEAVLREIPRLEWGLTTIKILAAVAPLLGLLGTVVGMIETFQSITLFGTGDPQLMAGGISQALVTTALGLVVAIPLLLLHNIASAKSRYLINIMEEQGAGLLAVHMQKRHGVYAHA